MTFIRCWMIFRCPEPVLQTPEVLRAPPALGSGGSLKTAPGAPRACQRRFRSGLHLPPASGSSCSSTPGGVMLEPPGGDFSALRKPIFEAPGQQDTKRQKGRTCKQRIALKLNSVSKIAFRRFLHQATCCLSLPRLFPPRPSLPLAPAGRAFRSRAGAGPTRPPGPQNR